MATSEEQALWHREQARRSMDVHRVKGLKDRVFKLVWDGYVDTIPMNPTGGANQEDGTADLPTYKVDKYLREIADLILTEKQDLAVKEENKLRTKRGEKVMEKWEGADQPILEGRFALTEGVGSMEARAEIYKEYYLGLVKEYGVENVKQERQERVPSNHSQLMGKLLGSKMAVDDFKAPIESEEGSTPLQVATQNKLKNKKESPEAKDDKKDKKDSLVDEISEK